MVNLILTHEDDHHNLTKTILNLDNWRVMGRVPGGKFCLITHDCKTYHVNGLTIKKFHAMIRMGLDIPKRGYFDSIALVCPKCHGSGVTDWVSDVVGVKQIGPFEPTFQRDPNAPVYKTTVYTDGKPHVAYFSRALVPEAHQLCTECKGTGLFLMCESMEDEVTEYTFR